MVNLANAYQSMLEGTNARGGPDADPDRRAHAGDVDPRRRRNKMSAIPWYEWGTIQDKLATFPSFGSYKKQ